MFIHSIYRLQVNYIFIFIDTKCHKNVFSGSQPSMLSLQIIDGVFSRASGSAYHNLQRFRYNRQRLICLSLRRRCPSSWIFACAEIFSFVDALKLNRFTAIIARGLMGLFLSPMGFRSMPVAVQLGRGLGATHGRWSCDRGGKERTRCATSEVYTRKLSKLLKKKQNSQKAF